jgi:hypothetical protein
MNKPLGYWIGYWQERFLNGIRWRGYPAPGPFWFQKPGR